MLKTTGTQAIAATSATAETVLAIAGTVTATIGTSATVEMPVRTGMFDNVGKPATAGCQ